jgi:hypothetical protein
MILHYVNRKENLGELMRNDEKLFRVVFASFDSEGHYELSTSYLLSRSWEEVVDYTQEVSDVEGLTCSIEMITPTNASFKDLTRRRK